MAIVFTASLAAGFCQNGVFAYVAGFGMGEYTQAIMIGQAVAGVLGYLQPAQQRQAFWESCTISANPLAIVLSINCMRSNFEH